MEKVFAEMRRVAFIITVLLTLSHRANSEVHFCLNNDKYTTLGPPNDSKELDFLSCPAGLLFTDPTQLSVVQDFGKYGSFCVTEDICKPSGMVCGTRKQLLMAQYVTGNFTVKENLEIFENEEGNVKKDKCRISSETVKSVLSRKKRTTPGESVITSNFSASKALVDETRRLLYFMAGIHSLDVTPTTLVAKLLEPSFQVIQKRCDPARLDPMFPQTILKGFQWLLTQAGANQFQDISTDTAKRLNIALSECSSNPHPIRVYGSDCLDTITEISLKKFGIDAVKKYVYDDEYVFQWGRYDPIVDAVWLVIDTIHGLCEPYFRIQNLQHEYYVAMLNLLRIDSIQTRWISPTPLYRQEIYDHVFISPMNKSMAILDACALGGSFDETYRRGMRPMKYVQAKTVKRQVRSISRSMSNASPEKDALLELVYCLQSEQDRKEKFKNLKRYQC